MIRRTNPRYAVITSEGERANAVVVEEEELEEEEAPEVLLGTEGGGKVPSKAIPSLSSKASIASGGGAGHEISIAGERLSWSRMGSYTTVGVDVIKIKFIEGQQACEGGG